MKREVSPKKTTHHDDISELLSRGVEEVVVKTQLEELLRSGKKITLYLGIDPTGSMLHIGHAIALRKLRDFQRLGHRVIFLIGSFTAMIGDTSDKESARQPMTLEQIEENFKTYKAQASKVLDFSKIELKYNGEWLSKLTFKEILELANKFTVQQMIERDMYQKRIAEGKPIGLHEFLYPLMQGYDSVAMNVDLEVGGRDQLFNMLAGRTLQKAINNREKHVLTVQLLEGTDGRKMSKTYNNVINLTDAPNDQYGKIMSIKDELIIKYFTLCTDLHLPEIADMEKTLKGGENPKSLKMKLAREIVTLYHGEKAGLAAEAEFINVFQNKSIPTDIPTKTLSQKEYAIAALLVEAGLASSKTEAQRLVKGGGVTVADKKITDPFEKIVLTKDPTLVKVGKRHFANVKN